MTTYSYTSKWDANSCQLTLVVTNPDASLNADIANAKITIIRGVATKDYTLAAGDYEKLTTTGLVFKNDFLSDIFLKDNSVGPDVFFDIDNLGNSTFVRDALSTPVLSFLNIVSLEYDRSETNSNMLALL